MEEKELYVWRKRVGNQFETLKDVVFENPDKIQQTQIAQDLCIAIADTFGRSIADKISLLELSKLILFNHYMPKARQATRDNEVRDKRFIDEAEEEMR